MRLYSTEPQSEYDVTYLTSARQCDKAQVLYHDTGTDSHLRPTLSSFKGEHRSDNSFANSAAVSIRTCSYTQATAERLSSGTIARKVTIQDLPPSG